MMGARRAFARLGASRPTDRRGKPQLPEDAGERRILELLFARQPRAIELMYDCAGQRMYQIALRILQDQGAAEDVVLDAHLELWQRPELALIRHRTLQGYLGDIVASAARRRSVER